MKPDERFVSPEIERSLFVLDLFLGTWDRRIFAVNKGP